MSSLSASPPRRRLRSRSPSWEDRGSRRNSCFVSVTNLPRDVTFKEAERLLDEFGRLAALPSLDRLRSSTEATAEFCDARAARAAVASLDGTLYSGRRIRVVLTEGPPRRPFSPKRRRDYGREEWRRGSRYGSRSASNPRGRDRPEGTLWQRVTSFARRFAKEAKAKRSVVSAAPDFRGVEGVSRLEAASSNSEARKGQSLPKREAQRQRELAARSRAASTQSLFGGRSSQLSSSTQQESKRQRELATFQQGSSPAQQESG
ncbi:hypothetical protein cyc_07883 [Cyclospora cayetanensis]|uniref:RRM domain-containing protein n=1 Tax=Cyclospora cayetanensis TaxID=88456 RepID=A0A1D3D2E2_9EIME|nr:hypothetical protein cyc_07883 [Cyclospora cayetanensis]